MNIVFLTPEFVTEEERGGLATYIYNISRALSEKGHRITVVVESNTSETFVLKGVIEVVRVKIDYSFINHGIPSSIIRRRSKELNRRLERLLKEGKWIDVVHYPNYLALALDRTAIPSVVRVSSDSPLWRAANQFEFNPRKVHECCRPVDYLEDIALMDADAVFGPSIHINEFISRRTGKRIDLIESPFFSVDEISASDLNLSALKGKKYILTFGSMWLHKGIHVIGKTIYDVLNKDRSVLWAFAGHRGSWINADGEEEDSVNYLRKSASEYENRLIYLGKLTREELHYVIKNAWICVLPSRTENFSNACIEAMSCGKIVIGTSEAGFGQLIEDKENGFLINVDDNRRLLETIEYILNLNASEKTRVEINARETVNRLEPELIAAQVANEYRKAIKASKTTFCQKYYSEMIKRYNEALLSCGEPFSDVEQYLLRETDKII